MHTMTYPLTRTARHLIVALCALLLLGAQQAALVHQVGHFSAATNAVTPPVNEGGSSSNLSHVCTTCLAFTALAAVAPLPAQWLANFSAFTETPVRVEFPRTRHTRTQPYAARAPPLSL